MEEDSGTAESSPEEDAVPATTIGPLRYFLGIIVAVALLFVCYVLFAANQPKTAPVDVYGPLVGSTVLEIDDRHVVFRKPDGTCSEARHGINPIDCPGASSAQPKPSG